MKTALVAIAKNEDHYIQEWINYYLHIGFDDIFIYQNDGWKAPIIENEHVHLLDDSFDQSKDFNDHQIKCYSYFFKNNYNKYDWIAVFDIDEFLVLKSYNKVNIFLSQYQKIPSICFHWRMFGDNNVKKIFDNNYSVINRFTASANNCSSEFKSIYNCNRLKEIFSKEELDSTDIIGIHEFKKIHIGNVQLDVLKYSVDGIHVISSAYNLRNIEEEHQCKDIAYLAHYRKSFLEYKDRIKNNTGSWWIQHKKDHPDPKESFSIMCPEWFNEVKNFDVINMLKN